MSLLTYQDARPWARAIRAESLAVLGGEDGHAALSQERDALAAEVRAARERLGDERQSRPRLRCDLVQRRIQAAVVIEVPDDRLRAFLRMADALFERLEHDVAMCVKHQGPIIISSLRAPPKAL